MEDDIKTRFFKTQNKIKKLTTELARATHEESCLKEILRGTYDHQLANNVVIASTKKPLMYSKKDLLEYIMFLDIPTPLLEIISEYTYQTEYGFLYNCYQSVYLCNPGCFKIVNNYFIEIESGTCYVVNIFTNELIDKYCFYECSCDCQHDHIQRKRYELVMDKIKNQDEQKKVYLLEDDELILIIIIKDNGCEFVSVDTALKQEEHKVNVNNAYFNAEEKKMITEIRSDLDLLFKEKSMIFDKDILELKSEMYVDFYRGSYIMNQQRITIGFYITEDTLNNILCHAYILEYDFEKKQIINCYKIEDVCKKNFGGFKFIFDNEYAHILPNAYIFRNVVFTYKKIVV